MVVVKAVKSAGTNKGDQEFTVMRDIIIIVVAIGLGLF